MIVAAADPTGQVLLIGALLCFAGAIVLSISIGFGEWKRDKRERMRKAGFSDEDVDRIIPLPGHWS